MSLISESPLHGFTIYLLGYTHSLSADERATLSFSRDGSSPPPPPSSSPRTHTHHKYAAVLKLTHNHGTEPDADFSYASGNADPGRGFGHIAITVDDVEAAYARFEARDVPLKKRPNKESMKGLALILDPSGYWVVVVSNRFRG
jgi:lactoylglutathione lyase